jgi:hypothetical protein
VPGFLLSLPDDALHHLPTTTLYACSFRFGDGSMGAWGGGLYSSDFACDLRDEIAGYMRAPISEDEILAEIASTYAPTDGADHVDAFDYWLVLADQLERRGIHRREILDRAIDIIENGRDVRALRELDAQPRAVAARQRQDANLLERLRNPRPPKTRRPIAKPLPHLFSVGEALAWPTDMGREMSPWIMGGFEQDGWGFGIVSHAGYRYGVLPFYAVQILLWRNPDRPAAELAIHCRRSEHQFGEVTQADLDRMQMEHLGHTPDGAVSPSLSKVPMRLRGIEWGLDAMNRHQANFLKFPHPAPSATPIDADAPDQRGSFEEFGRAVDERRRAARFRNQ